MAKGSQQKMKILRIMQIMLEETDDEHGLTLEELSEKLQSYGIEAERKALYDDFEVLRQFGIDIEMRRDKTTRYYVASRDFELPELKLLVDAVQASKFITHKKSNELIKKISSNASVYQAQKLQRQVFVSNRIKTMNESIYYAVDNIHEAINTNSMISFKYFEWDENKKKVLKHNGKVYKVSPWSLTWDDENYYLISYDHDENKIKHYRVDKMTNINLLKERREGEKLFRDFDGAIYSKQTFSMFGGKEELVTLRCKNHLAGVIIDRFGQNTNFYRVDDEHFEITVRVAISPTFLGWVMNFGKDIKIISPESVAKEFLSSVREVLSLYE